MKVHFLRMGDTQDWICYDQENTTGDLYVDPLKIDLLTDLLYPCTVTFPAPGERHYNIKTKTHIPYFGDLDVRYRLNIENNNILNVEMSLDGKFESSAFQVLVTDRAFTLDLPKLPAFERYQYPDDEFSGKDPVNSTKSI